MRVLCDGHFRGDTFAVVPLVIPRVTWPAPRSHGQSPGHVGAAPVT